MGYFYIALTIALTTYGQLVLKWRLNALDSLPESFWMKLKTLVLLVFDPYIFSSFFSAFLASLAWMAALKEFELSKAYPFMSLSYLCVLVISVFLFQETINIYKILGSILIVIGVVLISKS